MYKQYLWLFPALLSFLLSACGGEEKEIKVQSIAISQPSAELEIGETLTLKATVSPSNATYDGMTWTSTLPKVASVTESGFVSAISEGNTTITVMAGGKTASCNVKVVKGFVAINSISLNKSSLELLEGDSESLIASVSPEDATDKSVSWESSDNSIAAVDEKGKVTAMMQGSATITAKAGSKEATCQITVIHNTANDPIVTGDATNITYSTARITSYVNVDSFTEIGIVLSETNNNPMNNGAGCRTIKSTDLVVNQYNIIVKYLKPGVQYYYRAFYVANNVYNYAEVRSFNTPELIFSATTNDASDIQARSATLNGEYVCSGDGDRVMCYFLLYGRADDVETLTITDENGRIEDGKFSITISCRENTTYRYRAVVYHLETGIQVAGDEVSFTTLDYIKKLTLDSVTVDGRSAIVNGEVEWGEGIVGELIVGIAQNGIIGGDEFVTVAVESGKYSITCPFLKPNKECVAYVYYSFDHPEWERKSEPFYSEQIFSIKSIEAKTESGGLTIEIAAALDKKRYAEEFNTSRIFLHFTIYDMDDNWITSFGNENITPDDFIDGFYRFSGFFGNFLTAGREYKCVLNIEPYDYGYYVTKPFIFTGPE